MPTTSSTNPSADLILARTTLALAKSQRLIASWLPPPTASELASTKSAAEIEREEQELFTPVPELLGLGAPLPKDVPDGDRRRGELSSNERLRRQLLGREMAKIQGRAGAAAVGKGGGGQLGLVKPRPPAVGGKRRIGGEDGEEEEEEEESGRSSLGRKKWRGGDGRRGGNGVEEVDGAGAGKALSGGKVGSLGGERGRRAAGSYLDQVLAEKSLKKRRKKRRKESARVDLV